MKKELTLDIPNKPSFAFQQMARGARREYLVDKTWVSTPQGKPAARRLAFITESEKLAALDVFSTWEFLDSQKVFDPVLPEQIYSRLTKTRQSQKPVTIFIPWGIRPEGTIGPELQAIAKIQEVKASFEQRNIPVQILLMPADIYAVDVNGISKEKADSYFRQISEVAQREGFTIAPWSQIRAANRARYNEIAASLTEQKLEEIMKSDGTMQQVFKAARRRSETGDPRKAAFDYLRERVAEAIMIEELYQPIKMSMAPKNKDNFVDRDLPRLYVIPQELQLPWLK